VWIGTLPSCRSPTACLARGATAVRGDAFRGRVPNALRQVVARCIHGVDLNPLAVELCKVSLWMEAVEPGLPLTFLDSHVQHGNALLGTTPGLMTAGVSDAAWEPIEEDDKKVALSRSGTSRPRLGSVGSAPCGRRRVRRRPNRSHALLGHWRLRLTRIRKR
jgi:hypothetical protein